MDRTQMTFFVSFWDAINSLSKKDQLPVFRAVISYGLFGEHNENLTPTQNAFFALMQPVLDSSRKKAANGKHGGSKTKANGKQTEREKENEDEKENENEIEYESKEAAFARFWAAYPRKEGKQKAAAAFGKVTVSVDVLLSALERQKKSPQWTKDNGQFIPHPATWLNGKRWEDEVLEGNYADKGRNEIVPAWVRELDADEHAAINRLLEGDL